MRILACLAVLLAVPVAPAAAHELVSSVYGRPGGDYHWRPQHRARKPAPRHRHVRRRAPRPAPVKVDSGPPAITLSDLRKCDSRFIGVTSPPAQTVDEAKKQSRTLWRAEVQLLIGGAYMDPQLSVDRRWLCGITSPLDAMRDAATGNTEIYRCYFAARPCRGEIEQEPD